MYVYETNVKFYNIVINPMEIQEMIRSEILSTSG